MTGLSLDDRRPRRGGGARHRLRADRARRGRRRRHPPAGRRARADGRLRARHAHRSGLLDELAAGITLEAAQDAGARLRQASGCPSRARRRSAATPSATDRGFLARDMAELEAYLHYRIIDVSSIKELSRRWYPRAYFDGPDQVRRPPGAGRHPRVDRRAALLPRGRVRAAARPDHRAGPRRSPPATSSTTRVGDPRPGDGRRGREHPRVTGTMVRAAGATASSDAGRPSWWV